MHHRLVRIQIKSAWWDAVKQNYVVDNRRTKTNRRQMVREPYGSTDFDFAGRNIAWKHKKSYGIPRFFFTNGTLGFANYEAKDLSEYIERNSLAKTEKLVEDFCSYIIDTNESDEIPF